MTTELTHPEPVSGEVVDEHLAALAGTITSEYGNVVLAGRSMITHAIAAGEALLAAKDRVPRGEWERWLLRNFPDKHPKQHRLYMRIARHKTKVLEAGATNLQDAHQLLAGQPRRPHEQELRDEAHRLHHEEGLSYYAVAQRLGVSHHAVTDWLNPEMAERRRERQGAQSALARRAATQSERERVIDEHGGALADAYRKVRLAGQSLGEALELDGCKVPDAARGATQLALTKLRGVEDEIARAARLA